MAQLPYGMQLLLKRILKKEYAPTEWRRIHQQEPRKGAKA